MIRCHTGSTIQWSKCSKEWHWGCLVFPCNLMSSWIQGKWWGIKSKSYLIFQVYCRPPTDLQGRTSWGKMPWISFAHFKTHDSWNRRRWWKLLPLRWPAVEHGREQRLVLSFWVGCWSHQQLDDLLDRIIFAASTSTNLQSRSSCGVGNSLIWGAEKAQKIQERGTRTCEGRQNKICIDASLASFPHCRHKQPGDKIDKRLPRIVPVAKPTASLLFFLPCLSGAAEREAKGQKGKGHGARYHVSVQQPGCGSWVWWDDSHKNRQVKLPSEEPPEISEEPVGSVGNCSFHVACNICCMIVCFIFYVKNWCILCTNL